MSFMNIGSVTAILYQGTNEFLSVLSIFVDQYG